MRRGAHARVDLIAAVLGKDGQSRAASINDLSIGGAMMTARAPIGAKDEPVLVKFRVDVTGFEQYVAIFSVIRSSRPEPHSEGAAARIQHGLKFLEAPSQNQLAPSAFVFQTLMERSAEG